MRQHATYCDALQSCGLNLIYLPPDERHPDSTFVVVTALVAGRGGVSARVRAPCRLGESSTIIRGLVKHYSELRTIVEPRTVDGGDVCGAGDDFVLGISRRTD